MIRVRWTGGEKPQEAELNGPVWTSKDKWLEDVLNHETEDAEYSVSSVYGEGIEVAVLRHVSRRLRGLEVLEVVPIELPSLKEGEVA
jgi:hypothetical protein